MAAANVLGNAMPEGGLRNVVSLWAPPVDGAGKPLRDESGEIVTQLVQVGQALAAIAQVTGPVKYVATQYAESMSHVISMRYRPDVRKGMTVRYEGVSYLVQYALDPGIRHRWLHLLCMEEVPS